MITKIKDKIFQLNFQEFGSCVYLLQLENSNILVDSSSKENRKELIESLNQLSLKPEDINLLLLTHKHYDHIGNLELFSNAEIFDSSNINQLKIKSIKAIKTPGHSEESLCFLYKDILFSGDTLFYDGIGRTDLPGGNEKEMEKSLEKLKKLNYKILCPGHI